MNRVLVIVIFILILLTIIFSINTEVKGWSQIIKDGKDFIQTGENSGEGQLKDPSKLEDLSGYLYNILLAAGVIVAVVVATMLGIQFMVGGAEGQAKVKEMLVPFIVGCIIVFGGFGLWKIAITIGNSLENVSPNQYNFSEKTCPNSNCGQKVEPKYDIDKHTYVCPKCGTPM